MKTYFDLVEENKDKVYIEFYKIIDDRTLKIGYSIFVNLHCEFGICDQMMNHWRSSKKSEYNKEIQLFRKATGNNLKLVRTENSLGFTRLVYAIGTKKD